MCAPCLGIKGEKLAVESTLELSWYHTGDQIVTRPAASTCIFSAPKLNPQSIHLIYSPHRHLHLIQNAESYSLSNTFHNQKNNRGMRELKPFLLIMILVSKHWRDECYVEWKPNKRSHPNNETDYWCWFSRWGNYSDQVNTLFTWSISVWIASVFCQQL